MTNKIAVAVIHGMGSQGKRPQDPNEISFSSGLYRAVRRRMGDDEFLGRVVWREIFWSDILQEREERYVQAALKGKARWLKWRRFVMHNLADAAAYRKIPNDPSADVYRRVHERVADTIANLEGIVGPTTPLVVLAHSLGGHIMSNYIYDVQNSSPIVPLNGPFQNLETMCGLVTFGCNIPIFTFAYPDTAVRPIRRPGGSIPADKQLTPWWLNFNDKDDVLGMPLAQTSTGYKQLADSGELDDTWINSGNVWEFWNPLSHNTYWTDRSFYRPLTALLRKALKIGPVP